eukprot:266174-Alexandrium_andersonii.AAC.1
MPIGSNPPLSTNSVTHSGVESFSVVAADRSADARPRSGGDGPASDHDLTEGPGERHPVDTPGSGAAILDGLLFALGRPQPGSGQLHSKGLHGRALDLHRAPVKFGAPARALALVVQERGR